VRRALGRAGRRAGLVLLAAGLGGCALRSDVTKLRLQLDAQQRAAARSDSVTQTNLAAIARLVQGALDSLAAQQASLTSMRGDLRVDLYNVQQQLVTVQQLTGQSQQRLTELRGQLDQRFEQLAQQTSAAPPAAGSDSTAPTAPAAGGHDAAPGPDQLMELGLQQLRRGSPATARSAFAEFLRVYPTQPRAGDAVFFTGEAWAAEHQADSAAAAYRAVVQRYPKSGHVASALYKLGMIALNAGRRDDARAEFDSLVAAFPQSDEAALAREQLRALGPARSRPRP
jgi:tol-pal system protein YbgF